MSRLSTRRFGAVQLVDLRSPAPTRCGINRIRVQLSYAACRLQSVLPSTPTSIPH